jgi:hypothetical protein
MWRIGVFVGLVLVAHADAGAQPLAGNVELAVGVRWTGPTELGSADASETASNGSRFRLFGTRTSLELATGVEGSFRMQLGSSFDVGVSSSFSQAKLRSEIASDVEGVPDVEALENINELAIEGTMLARLNWRPFGAARPFISGGAGYLRHLHEDRTLIESGYIFHLGAGIDYVLRTGGTGIVKTTGIRLDGRAVIRARGVAFDDRSRVAPAVTAAMFLRF